MIKVNDKTIYDIVRQRIGNNPFDDLNDLDVSEVTDMSHLFHHCYFKGNISQWNTSNVIYMTGMFSYCYDFNGDISQWDTGNVKNMSYMFNYTHFNGIISSWNTSKVFNMESMFTFCEFDDDISGWDISQVIYMNAMFKDSSFKHNLSRWKINKDCSYRCMFENSGYTNLFEDNVYTPLPQGMDPLIAYGDNYDSVFKQRLEKTIESL